jgi:hypothetical protein
MGFTTEQAKRLREVKDTAKWPEGYLSRHEICQQLNSHFNAVVNVVMGTGPQEDGKAHAVTDDDQVVVFVAIDLTTESLLSGQADIDAWLEAYRMIFEREARIEH